MDHTPLSPDMWSDEADTEHLDFNPIDEDCSTDENCFNSLFKTPLSAPRRRRTTPLNRSFSLSNTKPVISQIPESLLPILNNHDISWTSSLATPITGEAANSSTIFNTEERKVLLPCEDETPGRRILFLDNDPKKAICSLNKTPKPVRKQMKNCVKSLHSTPARTNALPVAISLSPILAEVKGEANQTPLSGRVGRNRRFSSECRSSQEFPTDDHYSPSILEGQAVVTLSPPRSPVISRRYASRSRNKKTRLSLQSQQLQKLEHEPTTDVADLRDVDPVVEPCSSKSTDCCLRKLKGVETLLKDVALPHCRNEADEFGSVSMNVESLVTGSTRLPGSTSLRKEEDSEITSSPIISCRKIRTRKRKRVSLSLTSVRGGLLRSSPFKAAKNGPSSEGDSSVTRTQSQLMQMSACSSEEEASKQISPKALSNFSSENDLSINTIHEIYEATDNAEAKQVVRQPSKKLKVMSTGKNGEQKQEQTNVESRVREIKTKSTFRFPYLPEAKRRKPGFTVEVGQLAEYARLLEAAATSEGRVGKRGVAVETSRGFVPFSKLFQTDVRQDEVSSSSAETPTNGQRRLRGGKVAAVAGAVRGDISGTQMTRLVADVEKMLETQGSQWGLDVSKGTNNINNSDHSTGLESEAIKPIPTENVSFLKAFDAEEANVAGKREMLSVDGIDFEGLTLTTISSKALELSSASQKELSDTETSMRKASSRIDGEQYRLQELDTPKASSEKTAGLSSASRKELSISKFAMNNARKLFEETAEQVSGGHASKPRAAVPGDYGNLQAQSAGGFTTASGRQLSVSDAAIKKARSLLEEVDSAYEAKSVDVLKPSGDFQMGFSSASGKKCSVSDVSIKKARTLFDDVDSTLGKDTNFETPKLIDKMQMGFSSASGKKCSVSDASIKKARTLFDDVDSRLGKDTNFETPKLIDKMQMGFSSASGKKCSVSDASIKKARTLFDDVDSRLGKDTNFETPKLIDKMQMGFSSASGKKCSVSDASIKKARTLFDDGDAQLLNKNDKTPEASHQPVKIHKSRPKNSAFKRPTRTETLADKTEGGNDKRETDEKITLTITTQFAKDSAIADDLPNETEIAEVLQATEAFLADEEFTFPSWITTYTSSPSAFTDRMDMSKPMIDGANDRDGPLLGTYDRFRKAVTAVPAVKSEPAAFQTPYRKNERLAIGVRRRGSQLEFGTPFDKRARPESSNPVPGIKPVELSAEEVALLRTEAWETQKALVKIKDSASCRPCQGSQLLRKVTQLTSWKALTHGKMPGRFSRSQLVKLGVRDDVARVTAQNAVNFVFSSHNHYGPSVCRSNIEGLPVGDAARLILDATGHADAARFQSAFLSSPGVDPKLVPDGWVQNHLRWIVWKLAATELSFPQQFAARCLTPNIAMLQLKYRYDREIDRCERPALRRIMEQDDAALRRMVLCVAQVLPVAPHRMELEVTDGWYSVMASLDSELSRIVEKGGISVGTKLVVHGAELDTREPCYPLEAKCDVRLRLHANSTRRARWHARLGFQACPGPMSLRLRSLLPTGGLVGRVDVRIARVYQTLFVETLPSGDKVTRSGLAESRAVTASERLRRDRVEAVYATVQAELRDAKRTEVHTSRRDIASISSGSQLCRMLELAADPSSMQEQLTADQVAEVEDYRQRTADGFMRQIESRVQKTLEEEGGKRTVANLLKIRCTEVDNDASSAILSIWRASDDLASSLCEGSVVSVFNVTATGRRNGSIQLTAGRRAQFHSRPTPAPIEGFARRVTSFDAVLSPSFRPKFSEVDIVGVVTLIVDGNGRLQTVYLADAALHFVGVAVWNGLKESGLDDLLRPGAAVGVADLQWRDVTARRVPHLHVTETTAFSRRPWQPHLHAALDALSEDLKHACDFVEKACEKLLPILQDTSMPTNPVQALPDTFLHTEDPGVEKPSPAQQRIQRLLCYSDPPPLPPLSITNSQAIGKGFRLPAMSEPAEDKVSDDCQSPPLSLD